VLRWIGEGSYDEIVREIRRLLDAAELVRQLPAVSDLASRFARTGQPLHAGITNETHIGAERCDAMVVFRSSRGIPPFNRVCPRERATFVADDAVGRKATGEGTRVRRFFRCEVRGDWFRQADQHEGTSSIGG
jgi:diadenosine tetraphosphatase ApaH/serine/threonine PP2A family protein phosphatase